MIFISKVVMVPISVKHICKQKHKLAQRLQVITITRDTHYKGIKGESRRRVQATYTESMKSDRRSRIKMC